MQVEHWDTAVSLVKMFYWDKFKARSNNVSLLITHLDFDPSCISLLELT